MISAWRLHDEASRRFQLEFADEISRRVERLEGIVNPTVPLRHGGEGTEAGENMHAMVENLAAEVADIGNRLERIECLLMCSDLKHVQKIDNLLRQLKKDVLEQAPETESEEVISKIDSFSYLAATDVPSQPHFSDGRDTSTAGVLKVWPSYDERQEQLATSTNDHGLDPGSIDAFAPLCSKVDYKTDLTCIQHPTDKGREPLANEKPSAPALNQSTTARSPRSLDTRIEQGGKPVRFWRDAESIQGQERSVDTSLPPRETRREATVQLAQDSAGLTFDVTGELVKKKAEPKQKTSRGWNLAAEAAASGKRIVPKNR